MADEEVDLSDEITITDAVLVAFGWPGPLTTEIRDASTVLDVDAPPLGGSVRSTTMKRNDTAPRFEATLRDADENPINLSGASARFLMRDRKTRAIKVDGVCSIPVGTDGRVLYVWVPADTDTAGMFEAEVEVTFTDGTVRTAPSDGYHAVDVVDDVD